MESSKKEGDGSSSSDTNAFHIPSSSKMAFQRLKEIFNDKFSDFEIYSALKDSDMDSHLAILFLLAQDDFQEVKSKREKQKEMEARELRNKEKNSDTSSAVEVDEEHGDEFASSESPRNSNEYDKSVDKSDIVLAGSAPSSTLVCPVEMSNQSHSPHSDTLSNFSTRQNSENRDSVSSSGKRPGTVVSWNGCTTYPGMTFADIVRMGKPPHRHSQTAAENSNSQFSSFDNLKPSHDSSHSQIGVQKDPQGSEIRNSVSSSASITASLNDKVSSKDVDIATDLSRLSFDTYNSGVSTAVSESPTSDSLDPRHDLEKEGSSAMADSLDPRHDLEKEGSSAMADPFDPRHDLEKEGSSAMADHLDPSDTLSNFSTRQNSENRDSVSLSGKRPGTLVTWNRGTTYPGVSFADIVRMGKPPHRHSQTAAENSNSQFSSFDNLKPSHDSSHSQIGVQKDPQGSGKILSSEVISNYLDLNDVSIQEIRNSVSSSASSTASLNDKVSSKDVDIDLSRLSFDTYNSGVSTAVSESPTSDSLDPRHDLEKEGSSAMADSLDPRHDLEKEGSSAMADSLDPRHDLEKEGSSAMADPLDPRHDLEKEGSSAMADHLDPRNHWYDDQICRGKMLELAKESRYNAFCHFPEYESWRPCIPRAPNTYEYSSSSIPGSNYMNIVKPDSRNPPLHGELQSRSLPTTSEFARATYLVDSVITTEVSYSLPLPGVGPARGSAVPHRMASFPQTAIQHSYRGTAGFHDSQAGVQSPVPQFISGASRMSWPASGSNYFFHGDLGTPRNLPRQFRHEIRAGSAVGYGGIQSHYNEGTGHTVPQQARNSQLSGWDYGSSMRAVPNVQNYRRHSLHAENQLRFGYPQPQQRGRNYAVPGHSNVYNSQGGTIQDQQLGPGGLPFTQTPPPRPLDQFWRQRYWR